jgi:replicative DNA helicase
MNYNEIIPELKNIDYEEQMIVKISKLKGEQRAEFLAQCVDLGLEEKHFNDEKLGALYYKSLVDESFSHLVGTDIELVELRLKRWNDLGYLTNQNYLKNIVPELISLYERKQLMFKLGDIQDKILEEKDLGKLLGELDSIYRPEKTQKVNFFKDLYKKNIQEAGIQLGIKYFDDKGLYLSNGNLYALGADTGSGKTTTGVNIAVNQINQGNRVLYFNLEQKESDIVTKATAIHTDIPEIQLLTGEKLTKEDDFIVEDSSQLFDKYLDVIDRTDINSAQMLAMAKFKHKIRKYSLIIVDYWQLLAENEQGDTMRQKLIRAANNLLFMAKELNIPVLVLGQVTKAESRGELDRNSFAESKQLSNNSSYVFMIQKEERINQYNIKELDLHLEIVKSRKPNHYGLKYKLIMNKLTERLIN